MKYVIFTLVVSLSVSSVAFAAEIKSPEAKTALNKFDKAKANLQRKYEDAKRRMDEAYKEEIEKLKYNLIEQLEEVRKEVTLADNLDEAVALRD